MTVQATIVSTVEAATTTKKTAEINNHKLNRHLTAPLPELRSDGADAADQ